MRPFTTLSGTAAALLRDDINTDQIAPVLPERILDPDYAGQLFLRWRTLADGTNDPDFILNRPRYRDARILVAGRNFGCGSARESAAWAIEAFGIRCIVARSFAELFRGNCIRNGILPVVLDDAAMTMLEAQVAAVDGEVPFTVDLVAQTIICPDGAPIPFPFQAADKNILLEGLDEIGLTLQHADAIAAWERSCREHQPWLQTMYRQSD
jgi:3-isopropylmalate/(R)-2-methylmalate dehydratase small subunit